MDRKPLIRIVAIVLLASSLPIAHPTRAGSAGLGNASLLAAHTAAAPRTSSAIGSDVTAVAPGTVVWTSGKRSFQPQNGPDTLTNTFTASGQAYLLTVALSSGDSADKADFSFGDLNRGDQQSLWVQSGEQRHFYLAHFQAGSMPPLTVESSADGGRTLTYVVTVETLPNTPASFQGTMMATNNFDVIALNVAAAGTYTLHFSLGSSTFVITIAPGLDYGWDPDKSTDTGRTTGDGAIAVKLVAGPTKLMVSPFEKGGASMPWSLSLAPGLPPAAPTGTAAPRPAGTPAPAPNFSGRTSQGVKISFYQAGSTVSGLATSLSVLCITGYPASGSMIEMFPFAPRAVAKIANHQFTLKIPTKSKGRFATLTGAIHGQTASGTLTVYYDRSANVYGSGTGNFVLTVYACQAKTTWIAQQH